MKRFTLSLALLFALGSITCSPKPEPQPPRREARRTPPPPPTPPERRVKPRPPTRPRPVVAWRANPPRPGPAPAIVTPKVETRKLRNGLTVFMVRRPALPLVALRLVVRAGTHEDPPGRPGVASMTADMLNEGMKGMNAMQIANRAGQLGASLRTSAGEDSSFLSIAVLRRHLRKAMDLMSGAVRRPTFPNAELKRRQTATANYVRRLLVYPSAVASILFSRALFGAAHPYGRLDSGRIKDIEAITRADLVRYHKRHFRPHNAALIVVGDVTWKKLLPVVKRSFGRWRAKRNPTTISHAVKPLAGRLFVVNRPGSPQTVLRIGEPGPARKHPDMVKLLVMNTVLGGSFSSRINMNLREKHGYTYGAYSYFTFNRRPSPFLVATSVKTAATAKSIREILKELRSMATGGVSAAELELAKSYLSVSVSGWFVTNSGVAGAVSRLFLHELPLDFYSKFPARVKAVTRADVARVAKKHLHPSRVKVVVVGDLGRIGASLKGLGLGDAKALKP